MEPDNRTGAAAKTSDPDAPETAPETGPTTKTAERVLREGAADPAGARDEPVQLDPLELRIKKKEDDYNAAVEAGEEGKAERHGKRLAELKKFKADRDTARHEQMLLEAADALPDSGGLDDEESAADDQPRTPHKPKADDNPEPTVLPPAAPSSAKGRHWAVALSFVVMVAVPTALAGWYMWNRAADRYVSRAGFSVRTEEIGSAIELLGGVADLSGSSSSDPSILYAFIQSQEMVKDVDDKLDLRAMWAKADPEIDPLFAYHPPGTIEDMTEYWQRTVKVYNDDSGIIDLEVQAFSPEDAKAIAEEVYAESSAMINRLSAIAREDGTSYARDELETAVEQLRTARVAMTQFRNRTQIVDPSASLQSQMGIVSSLQQQLAEALIEQDILSEQAVSSSDPRMVQIVRRIEVIEARIGEERRKLGIGSSTGGEDSGAFANLVGEYESLQVDLRFAEESYTAARAAYDASVAEARRQSRYLAAHVTPTLPERAELPNRPTVLGLVLLFSFLAWAMSVLTFYALRDRN